MAFSGIPQFAAYVMIDNIAHPEEERHNSKFEQFELNMSHILKIRILLIELLKRPKSNSY